MATESPIRITETSGAWASLKGTSAFGSSSANMAIEELGLLLKGQTLQDNGRVLVPNRSGSAPPSMEGSFAAADNIVSQQNFSLNASLASINSAINSYVSEEELNADPAYVTYSSRVNLNPRFSPPLIRKANRYLVRHIGSAGNNRRLTSYDDYGRGTLLMSHSKLPTHREEPEDDKSAQHTTSKWEDRSNSFTYPPEAILSSQLKTVVDMIQEDFPRTNSPVYSQGPSLILESVEEAVTCDADCSSLHDPTLCSSNSIESIPSADDMRQTSYSDPTESISSSSSIPSSGNTLSKKAFYRQHSNTVDTHLGDDISTSGGGVTDTIVTRIESNTNSSISSSPNPKDRQHIHQHYMLQEQVPHEQSYTFDVQSAQSQLTSQGINTTYIGTNQFFHGPSNFSGADVQPMPQSSGFNPPMYATAAADHMTSSALLYPNIHPSGYFSPQYALGGYAFQSEALSPYVTGYIPHTLVPVPFDAAARPSFSPRSSGASFGGLTSHGVNMQHLNNYYGQLGNPMQPSFTDPLHMQYFQRPFGDAYDLPGQFDQLAPRAGAPGSQISALVSQKGPDLAALSVEQKLQHQGSIGHSYMNPGRVGIPYYVGSPRDMGILQFPTSAIASPVLPGSPVGGTSFFGGTNEVRFSPGLARNSGISSGWQGQRGINDTKTFSVLEELKSGKGRRFELSDIAGHIIEFSGDQHGSRFIQQKLETCSVEEKASVFKEVLPHTSKLMTDVFGNYVIQKFFEYGSLEQRKELANQLAGQILPLSLQMYGCRVIQKALEVIELEQKIKLVHELDGHVMRCVRDQNGNHVVQKCIETIPTHQIEFIIFSFRGQVATLSTHPYGCRVIQRVLEHCTDELQSQFIVDEILESVCSLAQDQYGNYVTQHVLERGKPRERSQIISKLSGHIVQLSQHKFASNVVEKCLEYGDSASLEIIIGEIIGRGDGNDNLLTMVKDQYANYVIQKIIQTCTGDQREMLLCRIRIHLNSLKKYTYGKHIVARFEQLYGEDLRHQDHNTFSE